jgi:hypothetical protein
MSTSLASRHEPNRLFKPTPTFGWFPSVAPLFTARLNAGVRPFLLGSVFAGA